MMPITQMLYFAPCEGVFSDHITNMDDEDDSDDDKDEDDDDDDTAYPSISGIAEYHYQRTNK